MTGIQIAAMRAAQRGDWTLADAIEVKHRIEHDGALCGFYVGSRLGGFVYTDREDATLSACQACKGTGSDPAAEGESPCGECRGSGSVVCAAGSDFIDDGDWVVYLNGETADLDACPFGRFIDEACADEVIAEYNESLRRIPVQANIFPEVA